MGFFEFGKKVVQKGMVAGKKIDQFMQDQTVRQQAREQQQIKRMAGQTKFIKQKRVFLQEQDKIDEYQERKRKRQEQSFGRGGLF